MSVGNQGSQTPTESKEISSDVDTKAPTSDLPKNKSNTTLSSTKYVTDHNPDEVPKSIDAINAAAANHPNHQFDLNAIRDLLESDVDKYLQGVRSTDVDWFLRDFKALPSRSGSLDDKPSEAKDEDKDAKKLSKKKSNTSLSPVSSHLTTNISNTNDHNLAKTKPSISPIQEEFVSAKDIGEEKDHDSTANTFSNLRRRGSVSSIGSATSGTSINSSGSTGQSNGGGSAGGFFSKLKGKFHRSNSEAGTPVNEKSSTGQYRQRSSSQPMLFKDNYELRLKKLNSGGGPVSGPGPKCNDDLRLTRTTSTPNYNGDNSNIDPKLNEYIKFYQQRDLNRTPSASSRRSSATSIHSPCKKIDENSIPEHPSKSPLPSALKNPFDSATHNTNNNESNETPSTSSRLSSFLKRRSVSNIAQPSNADKQRVSLESSNSQMNLLDSSSTEDASPEFNGLKPLKRVAFHSSTFLIDPPQQIPSRTPRKGNVEIDPNGHVRINPLTEEDKIAIEKSQMGKGGGLVVGGTGALGLIKHDEKENQVSAPEQPDDTNNDEEDSAIDKHAKMIAIDKPMIHQTRNPSYSVPIKKMALDLMYTRCCHLREILPIPAILKQIPKGSMAPLPILQLRNPTPTMVEVQTFADFLRIAPIICVSLDGVSLSLEQFKIILSAMSAKKQLEKISLRNTPIDHEGWSLLCWFLSRNTVLNKLDITQCPSLSVNLLKKKKRKPEDKKKKEEVLERMVCNRENRSDMDWSLFTATIIARGGIEELILTGCCITDLDIFEKFIKHAVAIKTNRLGLAYNQLSANQLKIINDHYLYLDFVRGIDMGYNDFSSTKYLNVLLEIKRDPCFEKKISNSSLSFMSLNATNLRFSDTFKEVFECIIMKFPLLRYLDLSNNTRLFGSISTSNTPNFNPDSSIDSENNSDKSNTSSKSDLSQDSIMSYFSSKIPLFPKLIRLHLENNNLSSQALVSIAKVLPFCKNLSYFSVNGNEMDLVAGSALIQALKNSRTLITLDCDYENFPDLFKERIGLYTMRNMERLLYLSGDGHKANERLEEETLSSSLTEQLNNILSKKAEDKLDLKDPEVVKFINKARAIRRELKETMNELFKLQWNNELNLEGKETLIRFVFIDSSIEKGLQLIDNSLLAADEPQSTSKMFMLGAAEDENNKYKMAQLSQDESLNTNLPVSDTNGVPHSSSPLVLSRSQSKTSLNNLNREEGSVLKLLKLHDFHEKELFESFESLSGDEIREKLMSVDFADLDKIIHVLEILKEKGISLSQCYCGGDGKDQFTNNKYAESRHLLDINEIQKKIAKLKGWNNQSSEKMEESVSEEPLNEGDLDKDNEGEASPESPHQGDAISQAYDKVLNDLA